MHFISILVIIPW